jgi:ribosomal protein S18 acetylase RimI-like enzyme
VVRRIIRPDGQTLDELQVLEREAFGDLGLRAYDLAVMAEAGMLLVASVNEEIVGGCQLMRMMDDPGCFFVVGFYVRPGWQGRRQGEALLAEVVRQAKSKGATSLLLTVAEDNQRALNLYKKAGFGVEEHAPDIYGSGEHRLLLRRRLEGEGLHGSV